MRVKRPSAERRSDGMWLRTSLERQFAQLNKNRTIENSETQIFESLGAASRRPFVAPQITGLSGIPEPLLLPPFNPPLFESS